MQELFTLVHDGRSFQNFPKQRLLDAGVPAAVIEAAKGKADRLDQIANIRSSIAKQVGDTPKILGITADATSIVVFGMLNRIHALSNTKIADLSKAEKAELDGVRAMMGDVDLKALTGNALAKIQSGEVVLTASIKGVGVVLDEVLSASTAVSGVLQTAAQGAAE